MKASEWMILSAFLLSSGAANFVFAEAGAAAGPEKKTQIETIVHDYLVSNPEVLVEASQALQKKEQNNMQEMAKAGILQSAPQLFGDTLLYAGNPQGSVTLVEFFDYQCIHCKKMEPVIEELVSKNPELRVVFKEFPIFGESSVFATKAAMAAAKQGKYLPMQSALLKTKEHLTNKIVLDAAKTLGLNMEEFQKDIDSQVSTEMVSANRKLAESIHLLGTPALIVAATPKGQLDKNIEPTFIPGGSSVANLQAIINQKLGK